MSVNIKMPKLGMTMKEGKISKWYKNEGDSVEKGEDLFEIETEKITNSVECSANGILFQIVFPAGTTVPVGTILAIVAEAGEQPERIEGIQVGEVVEVEADPSKKSEAASKPAEKTRVLATPAARRLAKELSVELAMVQGTGSGGRIKEFDVLKFYEEGPPAPRITPLAMEIAKQEGLDIFKIKGTGEGGKITKEDVERTLAAEKGVPEEAPSEVTVIPMKGIRKVIADNMHASLQNTAQLSTFTEVDVTEMVRFRNLVREEYKKEEVKISYNDIIIMATAYALKRHPSMNSTLVGDEIILHNAVHMGIAVALKEGLIVPKLRYADKKSLLQIAKEARELAGKARKGVLGIDEVTDGTFTITNVGMFGMDGFTPIINPPETGILGVGRVVEKPAVVNGEVVIRQMMTLSLTFDHRVVDGAPAMTFLKDLARYLQEPMLMLP
ncbi:MAG: 2-oxo acid dehydrogenase subunit E2 [Deltaproteobacteria bacterium]|nr:2-oxo acid dehydrogenase subunit E2 [Deltaproteobacteria bacterium]MBW2573099.1 2-oxo acid dehydrogenase subunit E2 [Deltaproteobacteria bacterium]MBW2668667.1 2-oxo acid dehydrogenase subunit E2 [Deltaproteobacteria bacterium]MBW2711205.1 2-oxo acid dehydrogenase subunit E2 [Deltaproteobacteria bacterium]